MRIIEGNILDIEHGIIVQQVNCQGVMGAGLAKQIRNKWPNVYRDYKDHIKHSWDKGIHPLGSINITNVNQCLVCNFYSQDKYSRKERMTHYIAFELCLLELKYKAESGTDIYFPYGIGCGLAGGDWGEVSKLIERHFPEAIIIKYKGA